MLKLWLIRHGMTEGNSHGRYIGVTDEPLCRQGRELLRELSYPEPEILYVSPMLRCRETAELLFPGQEQQIVQELSECDFGSFEKKNYQELSGNEDYQAWVDSNGTLPFPGGESREQFLARSRKGFEAAVSECIRQKCTYAALVIHGGTIMNLMEAYAAEKRSFYQWHVKNGGGYLVELEEHKWQSGIRELRLCDSLLEG